MANTISEYINLINEELKLYLPENYPLALWKSMAYTTLAGGKRIRAVLLLEICKALGGIVKNAIPTACAVEMLHAQSLIHDDLPCMDDDNLRRGKPTNHLVFGEANAVLAGDALITLAPQIILQKTPSEVSKENIIKVLQEYFIAAGAYGIVGGQVVDIDSENKKISKETLEYIHKHKTAKLFELCAKSGAILADAKENVIKDMEEFGNLLGLAFQITDDILDIIGTQEQLGKTPNKDEQSNKNTYPNMFGIEYSVKEVKELCDKARQMLENNNIKTEILSEIVEKIELRIDKI